MTVTPTGGALSDGCEVEWSTGASIATANGGSSSSSSIFGLFNREYVGLDGEERMEYQYYTWALKVKAL